MTRSGHPDIEQALDDLRSGKPIVVVDDEHRENEGDVVVAAQYATPEIINFMAREARGLVCVAMTRRDLDHLGLPLMVPTPANGSKFGSPFTVSVDARVGVTTGISAHDRARTVKVLIDPAAGPDDIVRPGHVFPLRAHDAGVLGRRGHTEAGVDLSRLAGLHPSAVICEIMADDGTMARETELRAFAEKHQLTLVSIEELAQYRRSIQDQTSTMRLDSSLLPTRYGGFEATAYRDSDDREHLLLKSPTSAHGGPLVRVHSECLTGDVFGSLRCDCGDQLAASLKQISQEGGFVIYLRQEGRGIGLANKVRAYALQDKGLDTVEANICLGFLPDLRDYGVAASMLQDQGIDSVRLLTNNVHKIQDLEAHGVSVSERVPLTSPARPENERYLRTKVNKLNHTLTVNSPKESVGSS